MQTQEKTESNNEANCKRRPGKDEKVSMIIWKAKNKPQMYRARLNVLKSNSKEKNSDQKTVQVLQIKNNNKPFINLDLCSATKCFFSAQNSKGKSTKE